MKDQSPRADERRAHETERPEGPDGGPRGVGTIPPQEWRAPEPGQLERVHRYSPRPGAPCRVAAWLHGAGFPATPYDLMRHAERMGAPDEVVMVLRTLPARRYMSLPEVSRAVALGLTTRRW